MMPDPVDRAAARIDGFVAFFEQLTPSDLDRLAQWYADNAFFKDPFNEVNGIAPIRRIFEHMFAKLDVPRFVVIDRLTQGDQAFLTWTFEFRFRGESRNRSIRGATHLRFDVDGRVSMHRDYWDAAEELYEQLPLLGGFMRWLKRMANR